MIFSLRQLRSTVALSVVIAAVFATLTLPVANAVAVPTTIAVEGVLRASSGGPVADGNYAFTFSIYADAAAKTPLWQEGPTTIPVASGRFVHALGSKKALVIAALVKAAAPEFGVQVAQEPALPRRPLRTTLFALHAATAAKITCSGCISGDALAKDAISVSEARLRLRRLKYQRRPCARLGVYRLCIGQRDEVRWQCRLTR